MTRHFLSHMESNRLTLLLYACAIGILLGIAAASQHSGIPISHFTRDPASVMNAHFYTGILSNIGILFWCIAATTCLFACLLLIKLRGETAEAYFLLYFGTLSAMLLIDDFFLLHEILSDLIFKSERLVYLMYMLILGYGLVYFRQLILRTDFKLLTISLGFFSASVVFDLLPEGWSAWHHLLEDGAKFMGIVVWCNYFAKISWRIMTASQPSHALTAAQYSDTSNTAAAKSTVGQF